MRVGMICFEPAISARISSRASGTATSPTLGSMVQKGKFAACAAAVRVRALKSVDLPTFGRPTIPMRKPMIHSLKVCRFIGKPSCQGKPGAERTASEANGPAPPPRVAQAP